MSVGRLEKDAHLTVTDVDRPDREWPWRTFAKHATQNQHRSLATLSVARTWRTTIVSEPMAGDEGCVSVTCGQPVSTTSSLLVSVLPLRRPYGVDPPPDERLEHTAVFKPGGTAKGASRLIKFGPICRAGAHVVSVTLNGAHVVGSPLHITVTPGPPEPSVCELRPYRSLAAGHSDWCGANGAVLSCSGVATGETLLAIQLRDRYGNRCTNSQAAELLAEGAASAGRLGAADGYADGAAPYGVTQGLMQIEVGRHDGEGGGEGGGVAFDPATATPSALLPSQGSAAAAEHVACRIVVAADGGGGVAGLVAADAAAAPGAAPGADARAPSACGRAAVVARARRAPRRRDDRPRRPPPRQRAAAARRPPHVRPRPRPPGRRARRRRRRTRSWRARRRRRAAAWRASRGRSVSSRATPAATPPTCRRRDGRPSASAASDDHYRIHAAAQAAAVRARAPTARPPAGGSQGVPPPLLFTSAIEGAPDPYAGIRSSTAAAQAASLAPRTAILTYRCDTPGSHELSVRLGNRMIGDSPSAFTALVPAWGAGLREGVAGETAVFYVRLRAEGSAPPGSAAGRRLMHGLAVEAYERHTNEVAAVTTRQVAPSVVAGGGGGGGGGGEVAEVAILATHASRDWVLSVQVDHEHIVGSPFAWGVTGLPLLLMGVELFAYAALLLRLERSQELYAKLEPCLGRLCGVPQPSLELSRCSRIGVPLALEELVLVEGRRDLDDGVAKVVARQQPVEPHEDRVGGLRVGQHDHDLVGEDHREARDEVEDDDRDLRGRRRVEEE